MPSKRSASVSNIEASRLLERSTSSSAATNASGSNAIEVAPPTRPTPIELHRDAELGLDGEHDAALGGAVELGEHDAGHVDRLRELARPG